MVVSSIPRGALTFPTILTLGSCQVVLATLHQGLVHVVLGDIGGSRNTTTV
ncbi:hypothetical protein PF005_g20205 [Phytophthora fragariae]|uniref:Uncharacterized protein n=2 Tax=Phytophthora TaxID=4783 RepID=A0A6A3WMY1_9STRA|nr:hypothetical protein PF003_g24626 [Phytophthora fragariae]KAE8996031.1 hypothetical protein PR002_g19442 [Phytophthora rubi]KAE8928699.1 hypothetical protein PF009_g21171 [Phytophthora fragariae]KAE8984661.1 hypothetical protein PF011_g20696 [Phytophthora fragariae]KAE9001970.1 hypothetical protein PR001_g18381 [Phytophthora rubi]